MKKSVQIFVVAAIMVSCFSVSSAATGDGSSSRKGKYVGWIGVKIQDVNEKIAKREKLKDQNGAYVTEVVEDSPADSAGIKEEDVITQFAQKSVNDADDLMRVVRETNPGTKVIVIAMRDGEEKKISLIVGKNREKSAFHYPMMPPVPEIHMFGNNRSLGLELLNLNEQLGEYFGAPNNEGVLVQEVEKKSTGDKAGFKAGDVIIRAGKRTVDEIEDITRELRKHDEGDKVEIEILRKGQKKVLSVELEDRDIQGTGFHNVAPKFKMRMFRDDCFDDANLNLLLQDPDPESDCFHCPMRECVPDQQSINDKPFDMEEAGVYSL